MNPMTKEEKVLLAKIQETQQTKEPIDGSLETDELVLARITEGIYRQPASALRELVSNAYDADATEVVIQTDMPRFDSISVRDNGRGLTPEILTHLVKHIGGSAKRNEEGKALGITDNTDTSYSVGGRKLIGKLGIGLFSVAQFTRHFLIITKTKGDPYRTVADITLGRSSNQQQLIPENGVQKYETGKFRIWRERASKDEGHGTEIKLLELLPRTRDEFASADAWAKQDFPEQSEKNDKVVHPELHIGRYSRKDEKFIDVPELPWNENDNADIKFKKLVDKLRSISNSERQAVDLRKVFDNYLWSMWILALSAPLTYIEEHPFDLAANGKTKFFTLQNQTKGQAQSLNLQKGETPREQLDLCSPNGATADEFRVFMDGVELLRPIIYKNMPKTQSAIKDPMLFIGRCREEFESKPRELSGGPLEFEAYLYWAPRIIPKQHQGVVLRVGNASGALFDPDFMGYETSELTRKSQVTAEIFVKEGLDDAINIDRESFNFSHPHYQFLTKWMHSAFRQFSNRNKEIGKELRVARRNQAVSEARDTLRDIVEKALATRGIEDFPEVRLVDDSASSSDVEGFRAEGIVVLHLNKIFPGNGRSRQASAANAELEMKKQRAIAITQLLYGIGLLEELPYSEQEGLIKDILTISLENLG